MRKAHFLANIPCANNIKFKEEANILVPSMTNITATDQITMVVRRFKVRDHQTILNNLEIMEALELLSLHYRLN